MSPDTRAPLGLVLSPSERGRQRQANIQVTFDCDDPHRLARFWAGALRYEKEDNVGLVKELLDAGRIPQSATVMVDGGIQFADVSRAS